MSQTPSSPDLGKLQRLGRQLKEESKSVAGKDHGEDEVSEIEDPDHTEPGQPHLPPESPRGDS